MQPAATLDLRLESSDPLWPELLGLLQAGFSLEVVGRRSVRVFIREILGFDNVYIETGISTVFVDGQPVDDLDLAQVGPGSRLALSAAMPGLVGAVMRIRSPYASFRATISYPEASGPIGGRDGASSGGIEAEEAERGLVSVKLFNSVMAERGRELLGRGLYVDAAALGAVARAGGAPGFAVPDDLAVLAASGPTSRETEGTETGSEPAPAKILVFLCAREGRSET